jgi:hypothetical protein
LWYNYIRIKKWFELVFIEKYNGSNNYYRKYKL